MPDATKVWLSLGSNIGDRKRYLQRARKAISAHPGLRILRCSSELENPALLYTKQADFLNQILECECRLAPFDLLDTLQEMERSIGRISRFRNGPREIDLDILLFGQKTLSHPRLTIPHPGLLDRPYLSRLFSEFGMDAQRLYNELCRADLSGQV